MRKSFEAYKKSQHSGKYLSEHFSEWEFIKSSTALTLNIDNRFESLEHRENATILCEYYLEELREIWQTPIYITSGYRSRQLNKIIGGQKESYHKYGMAADIVPRDKSISNSFYSIIQLVDSKRLYLPDQVILYKDRDFIHFGVSNNPRGQFLEYKNGKYHEIGRALA